MKSRIPMIVYGVPSTSFVWLTTFGVPPNCRFQFFFFKDTAPTQIYTLSLHDALPICTRLLFSQKFPNESKSPTQNRPLTCRSEEHTSELQSRPHLVCRLLLEKKK